MIEKGKKGLQRKNGWEGWDECREETNERVWVHPKKIQIKTKPAGEAD